MKHKKTTVSPPPSERQVSAIHAKVLSNVKKMSTKQLFASLVATGIYTKEGKLTAHYGG
jgi:hypothetical protein